ncbi:MAG: SDR family NAD(P)-dependent oxidoreductase, partial [Acidimicrobiales bacterium]|nr:SDR family NAD(P)-dependent oxidoreductase [Acidimicrobiales bacterium]
MDVGAAAAASYAPDLFAGRTVLITGGGTGIGRATAHGFARLGGTVVIASRDEAHLAPTVDELRGHGGEVLGVACNIRDVDSVEALLATCTDRFGGVDVL